MAKITINTKNVKKNSRVDDLKSTMMALKQRRDALQKMVDSQTKTVQDAQLELRDTIQTCNEVNAAYVDAKFEYEWAMKHPDPYA